MKFIKKFNESSISVGYITNMALEKRGLRGLLRGSLHGKLDKGRNEFLNKNEAKKNKIEGNHVITHPDSLPKNSKEKEEQFQGGVDIKSFEPEFKYNFNSTTEDDDIKEKDAEEFIKPHKKYLKTFESFAQDFCGCCERCNCSKDTLECICHCNSCICHSDIKSVGESNEVIDDDSETEPWYEPEWCEDCSSDCEESGIEYEPNFTWTQDSWICDHCRGEC